jgi:Flp pilus assembly pilin Flp
MTNVTPRKSHCAAGPVAAIWLHSHSVPIQMNMTCSIRRLWSQEDGQDVAEYAVMLAIVLTLTIGTVRLIGANANNVFSSIGSAIQ